MQNELKGRGVGRLDGRAADLAIALGRVRVAGIEERALLEYRHVERRAGNEFLAVEVAGKRAGRPAAAIGPLRGRRQNAHHAHERPERHFDALFEHADISLQIEKGDLVRRTLVLGLAQTAAGCAPCSSVRNTRHDRQNTHFE